MKRLSAAGIFCLVLAIVLAGCAIRPAEQNPATSKPNPFDYAGIAVGDAVADMKVTGKEDKAQGTYGRVTFTGEITLTGTYEYFSPDVPQLSELTNGRVMFAPDAESAAKLPKIAGDERTTTFLFRNLEASQAAFGPAGSKGTATVTIANYEINYYPAECYNYADLVKVKDKR